MWGLAPWPGFDPGLPALGIWSPTHWTTSEVPGCVCLIVLTRVACVHAWHIYHTKQGLTTHWLFFSQLDGAQPVKGNHRITTFPRPSLCTDVTLNHSHMLSQFIFTALGGSYHPCSGSEVRKFGQVSQIEATEKWVWRIRVLCNYVQIHSHCTTQLCLGRGVGTWLCMLVTRPAETPGWIILCCPDLFFNGIRNEWKLKDMYVKALWKPSYCCFHEH